MPHQARRPSSGWRSWRARGGPAVCDPETSTRRDPAIRADRAVLAGPGRADPAGPGRADPAGPAGPPADRAGTVASADPADPVAQAGLPAHLAGLADLATRAGPRAAPADPADRVTRVDLRAHPAAHGTGMTTRLLPRGPVGRRTRTLGTGAPPRPDWGRPLPPPGGRWDAGPINYWGYQETPGVESRVQSVGLRLLRGLGPAVRRTQFTRRPLRRLARRASRGVPGSTDTL